MLRLSRNGTGAVVSLAAWAGVAGWAAGQEADLASEHLFLSSLTQLTSAAEFAKAGEAYFSPDMRQVIFQAVPRPAEGAAPDPHYSMYVAELRWEGGVPVGLGPAVRISEPGSANTCGWFHPTRPGEVLWGTTRIPPAEENIPGFQRGSGRYVWQFPAEMELERWSPTEGAAVLFEREGYTAEASWSPDGRHVLYTQVDRESSERLGRADADILVFDTATSAHVPLVVAPGYDGGPFFSPDASWICYRSDRRGDNLLQLFAAELDHDASGAIVGVRREVQLTDDEHVNWAPFWHPSGRFLVYTTSARGHSNYELYAVAFEPDAAARPVPRRITESERFDGLGVFSADARWMMWTSQRSDDGSSQLWIARFDARPMLGDTTP